MNSARNTKKYTYRTDADVNASLNAMGVETCYTVLIAGVNREFGKNYTLAGAIVEVKTYAKVFGFPGVVLNAKTGEIVAVAE